MVHRGGRQQRTRNYGARKLREDTTGARSDRAMLAARGPEQHALGEAKGQKKRQKNGGGAGIKAAGVQGGWLGSQKPRVRGDERVNSQGGAGSEGNGVAKAGSGGGGVDAA